MKTVRRILSLLEARQQQDQASRYMGSRREGRNFRQYPIYASLTIPAGTYSGVDYGVRSIQDAALWIASENVAPEHSYNTLTNIYTKKDLSYLVQRKSTARSMSVAGALTDIVIPVHRGARTFWKDQGLTLTDAQKGR